MTTQDIKQTLEGIISKMSSNTIDVWSADLESTTEAVVLDNYCGDPDMVEPSCIYNGWFEELQSLLNKIK